LFVIINKVLIPKTPNCLTEKLLHIMLSKT